MSQAPLDMALISERLGPVSAESADYGLRGYHLRLELAPARLQEAAIFLKGEGYFLEFITAVDWGGQMDLLYFFGRPDGAQRIQAAVRLGDEQAMPSLTSIFSSADWQEREVYDLFGAEFIGHPELKRLLLPEDADFHPLRKDFQARPEHAGDVVNLDVEL